MGGRRYARSIVVAAATVLTFLCLPSASALLPSGYRDDPVVSGLDVPRDLAFLPSGDIIVIENEGLVKVVESGVARELLDLVAAVRVSGEQGLLGVAIDPDFPSRPYIYFHYTADETPGHIRLSRFTFVNESGPGPIGIDSASEVIFIGDIPDNAFNHNGGTVRFGPDKRLYMSIGEDADQCSAQNLSSLKGKILRINVNDSANPAVRSTLVPSDNPFASNPDPNAGLVFAYGLRNPFRLDIDPDTGTVYIADVGQSAWEEIDVATGGENFGWPYYEGFHLRGAYNRTTTPCAGDTGAPLVLPIYEYANGGPAAVMLDAIYRGVDYPNDASFPPEFEGAVFLHDFYDGEIRALTYNASNSTWSLIPGVSSINWATGYAGIPSTRIGPDGALYYANAYNGALGRIVHVPSPVIASPAVLPVGTVGVNYSFDFDATGGGPPYNWSISAGIQPPGLTMAASTGMLAGTPTTSGTYSFTVNVTGTGGQSALHAVTVTIRDALAIAAATLPQAYEGEALQFNLTAVGGVAPFIWQVASGSLPQGVGLQGSTGVLGGTPGEAGAFSFTVGVSDPEGRNATRAFTLDVIAAVQLATSSLPSAEVFVSYTATAVATGGVAPYSWSLSTGTLPGGLNLSSGGTIDGTPLESGLFPITLRVEDVRGRAATRLLDLVVAPAAGGPPFVSVSFAPDATSGQPYSWNLTAAGGYPPFNWTITSGALPAGLNMTQAGAFSGMATQTGNFTFTVQVTDSWNQTDNATFTIHVVALPHSIVILPIGDVFAGAGAAMSPVDAQWTGQNVVEPLVWQAAGLPSGLSVDANGRVSGEPTEFGEFVVTLAVRDSAAAPVSANTTFTIRVPRVDVVPRTLPTLQVGVSASELLTLPDGYYAVNYTVSSGTLPPGLTLSSAGALVGTPTAAGNYTFTVRATGPGPASNFDEETFTVDVKPAVAAPPDDVSYLNLLWMILLLVIVGSLIAFVMARNRLRRRPQ